MKCKKYQISLLIATVTFMGCSPHEVKLAERVEKSTVKIGIVIKYRGKDAEVSGSGVAIAPHLILTARHVVASYTPIKIFVKDFRGNSYIGFIANISSDHDLALVYVPSHEFTPIAIARRGPRVGSKVYAVGYPLGLFLSYTEGTVNALVGGKIVHQCPIIFGNSGGPLVNSRGQLVGINVAILTLLPSWSGISVAESVEHIREFLQ